MQGLEIKSRHGEISRNTVVNPSLIFFVDVAIVIACTFMVTIEVKSVFDAPLCSGPANHGVRLHTNSKVL